MIAEIIFKPDFSQSFSCICLAGTVRPLLAHLTRPFGRAGRQTEGKV